MQVCLKEGQNGQVADGTHVHTYNNDTNERIYKAKHTLLRGKEIRS